MTPLGCFHWLPSGFVDSSEVVVSDTLIGVCTAFLVCCPPGWDANASKGGLRKFFP